MHPAQAMQLLAARTENSRRIAALVQAALLLREAIAALPALVGALAPAQSELLKAVCPDNAPPGCPVYRTEPCTLTPVAVMHRQLTA